MTMMMMMTTRMPNSTCDWSLLTHKKLFDQESRQLQHDVGYHDHNDVHCLGGLERFFVSNNQISSQPFAEHLTLFVPFIFHVLYLSHLIYYISGVNIQISSQPFAQHLSSLISFIFYIFYLIHFIFFSYPISCIYFISDMWVSRGGKK